jgi:RNA-directed DNA polymerase
MNHNCLYTGSWEYCQRLDNRSRMSREVHVRFCEGLRVKFPRPTRPIIHCKSEQRALEILAALKVRLTECKLELHPQKTKIIYCKDKDRTGDYPHTEFDFLGYTFKRIFIKDRLGRLQFNFLASLSRKSAKAFRDKLKALNIHHRTGCKIEMLAELLGPMIRSWLNYFGRFHFSAVRYTMDWVNRRLIKWAMCKYKRFKRHQRRAIEWLRKLAQREPNMFSHWTLGIVPS